MNYKRDLFSQIQANRTRTKYIMVMFAIVTAFFGGVFGYVYWLTGGQDYNDAPTYNVFMGAIVMLIIGAIYSLIMMHSSINIVMAMNHGTEIHDRKVCPVLWDSVNNMAIAAGLPMPRVFIINDPSPNAFSIGNDPGHSAIGATAGLLNSMNQYEIEGVVGHEMSHIKDHDTQVETVGVALTTIFSFIGGLLWNLCYDFSFFDWIADDDNDDNDDDNDNSGAALIAIGLVLCLVSWLCTGLAYLIQMALSRNREYLADAGSVDLTRNPDELIDALASLENVPAMKAANPASNCLYITNPHPSKHSLLNLFDTHPPLADRIRRLEMMKGE